MVPYLSDQEIERRADVFLDKYHPKKTAPVPIDIIVECRMKITVIPIPGLESRFGMSGYTTNDMTTFVVDKGHSDNVLSRHLFTLAHETAHLELHGNYMRETFPENIEDWKQRLIGIDKKLYRKLEYQANHMAAAILVPRGALCDAWEDVKQYASKQGFDVDELDGFMINRLAAIIGRDFRACSKTVEIALRRYNLI